MVAFFRSTLLRTEALLCQQTELLVSLTVNYKSGISHLNLIKTFFS